MKPLSAAAFVGWHSADELKHQMCCVYSLSPVRLFAEAHQAPLSLGFPRQEYWNRLPFPPPGDPLNPGIEPPPLATPALVGRFFAISPPGKLMAE